MRKRYKGRLPEKRISGTLIKHMNGFGFVKPHEKTHADIYIPVGSIGSALTKDEVEVSVKKRKNRDAFYGSITRIKKRHWEYITGVCEVKNNKKVILNHEPSGIPVLEIQNPNRITIEEKSWIKVKITYHSRENQSFKGEAIENLGTFTSSAKDDNLRALFTQGISCQFPKSVMEDLKKIPDTVRKKDFEDRKNLTDKPFVTIDGVYAKDYDDAIYVEKTQHGFRLFVAIADVSYYVQENSNLDKEAYLRGNSTYLSHFVNPMLPEKLSNDLCSLNPNVPRLVMTSEMSFDFKGDLLKSSFYPAVIKSHKRCTYKEVQEAIDDSFSKTELQFLKPAEQLGKVLLKNHLQSKALDFNIPEIFIEVNEEGEPLEVKKVMRLFSHKLIEQFMLAANQAASAFLEKKQLHLIYRIHESPEKEKIKHLEEFARSLGFSQTLTSRKNFCKFLTHFKNHSKEPLINKLTLRTLPQARYSAYNKKHYGLNFNSYTHFTSPIRRYCDLAIHRLLKEALSPHHSLPLSQKKLEETASSISQKEQISVKAERMVMDIKKARFIKNYLGEILDGRVSSVVSFGFFVNLEKFSIEGLVKLKDLPGLWKVDDKHMRLENTKTRRSFQFGDKIKVKVVTSNIETGEIDLQLVKQ